jgi:hypothetical protein
MLVDLDRCRTLFQLGGNTRTSCLKKRRQALRPAEKSGAGEERFGLACDAFGAADCAPLRDENAG